MNVEHPGRIPNEDSAASVNHRSATGWPDFLIRAVAGLAASGPETFIEGLDWSVKADLECMAEIDPGRGPAAPFQTESWLAAWACTQDGKHRTGLRILCGKLGATTLVVIPLCVKRHMGLRVAEMVAQEVSDYNHPLLHPAIREHADDIFMAALWRHAGKMLGDIDCLSLRKLNVRPKWGRGDVVMARSPMAGTGLCSGESGMWSNLPISERQAARHCPKSRRGCKRTDP